MAVTTSASDTTKLGCGRDVDDVWDNIDHPPSLHEAGCPDCQAARADLAALNTATQQMVMTDAADPTLRVDPDVLDNIVAIARSEVRRGNKIPLRRPVSGQLAGELTISEQTIATLVRRVSDQIPEIEARRCHVRPAPIDARSLEADPSASVPAGPTQVTIDLSLTVLSGVQIGELVNTLRNRIILAVAAEIGVEVTRVDITVDDLHDPVAEQPPGEQPPVEQPPGDQPAGTPTAQPENGEAGTCV